MSQSEISFENALLNLEKIVLKLEEDNIPLEKAIDLYQDGMKLSKLCSEKLSSAEDKMVSILNETNKTEPFVVKEE